LAAVDKLEGKPEVNYPYEPFLGPPFRYINTRRYKIIHKKDKLKKEIRILGVIDTKQDSKRMLKVKRRRM